VHVAVDRTTVLENAQRLAARGQLEKAIEEWSKLAAESPTDGTVFNTIGDLQLKRNAPLEAIEAYFRAASAFQQRGFALKTIAVYKKILKIDPNRFEVYRFLGDLNAERGLIRNAIGDYLTVARFYLKEGNNRKALELYRTIVKLDPTNLAVRQRVAELCVKEKLTDEAIAEYLELAKASLAQQRPADAQQAYRAILQIDPAHREAQHGLSMSQGSAGAAASAPPPVSPEPELKIEPEPKPPVKGEPPASQPPDVVPEVVAVQPEPIAAQAEALAAEPEAVADVQTLLDRATRQLEAGRYQEAELLASQALAGEPGNSEGRQLLALIKLKKGDLAAARVEIESIVEAALRDQDYGLAESALRHYLSVDPKCVSLLEFLGQVYERNGDPMSATIQYGKAIEALLEHPQAERATLPAELYAKIKAISPNSPLVARFAEAFGPSRLQESPVPLPTEEKPPVLELEIGYHHDLPAQAPPVGRTETGAQRADETPAETAPEEAPEAERKRRRISYL
jgi:tetratricopeptide (TPR) repeat protein